MKEQTKADIQSGWELSWIAEVLGVECFNPEIQLNGTVCIDSREVVPGCIFVAIKGENNDGHNYLQAARSNGAAAAIVENELAAQEANIPYLKVDNTVFALGRLAQAHLQHLRKTNEDWPVVIGITGSSGKTTTKDMLALFLSELGPTVAPKASFNNEVGMPLTVLRANRDTRYLVLEMGASGPGHLSYLTTIAPIDYAVLLMIGSAHLGGFGSQENLVRAKAELVGGLRDFPGAGQYRARLTADEQRYLRIVEDNPSRKSKAVLNVDDAWISSLKVPPFQALGFGVFNNDKTYPCLLNVQDIELKPSGQVAASIISSTERHRVELSLVGEHHLYNFLAAATVAYDLGLPLSTICSIASHHGAQSPHRMSVHTLPGDVLLIDDSYNANLDSMSAGIKTLTQISRGNGRLRAIAILGEMLELGAASEEIHRKIGRMCREQQLDFVGTVGNKSRFINDELGDDISNLHFNSADEVTAFLNDFLKSGDTLLLKGSSGSGVWKIADRILEERG